MTSIKCLRFPPPFTPSFLLIITTLFVVIPPLPSYAHEPLFGLGPHTIFKGGLGVEVEIEGEKNSSVGEKEKEYALHSEIIYGITTDLSATLALPLVLDKMAESGGIKESSSGSGDLEMRLKYRFWRHDQPGIQDAAAVIIGTKLPTGDDDTNPRLGSGSTDFTFGLTAARESLVWYYFGDLRYRLNTKDDRAKSGDRFFADVAIGIRPWPTEYLKPDLVLLAELNWETWLRNEFNGTDVANTGGDRLFFSPSFFFTIRNWAIKGGVQLPLYHDLHGDQPEDDYRFKLAVELHY
ncbi:MAG: transporter [Thermodesulfobacteriota bacterium]